MSANRILLGNKNGSYGIWISRPGIDVLANNDAKMLMTMNKKMFQVLQWGTFSFGDNTEIYIYTADQGFTPVSVFTTDGIQIGSIVTHGQWVSRTAFRMWRDTTGYDGANFWYYITNEPIY